MGNFIIYCDILGFKQIPKDISSISGFYEEFIREKCFSEPIKEKINNLPDEIRIENGISEITSSDNYIIICENMVQVFEIINILSSIEIPHKESGNIPLEIAMDYRKFSKDDVNPINNNEIIDFLSNDILTPYKNYYSNKHKSKIKETFIVATKEFIEKLDFHDKIPCNTIDFQDKNFFSLPVSLFQEKLLLYNFLSKIGIDNQDKSFIALDWTYIKPKSYEKIKDILDKKRVIFFIWYSRIWKNFHSN